MAKNIQIDSSFSRSYRLGKRQAAIDETRTKIIEAARALILSERALAGFSIDAVAKQAGVSRMTVYNQFGGKPGLLDALFDDIGNRGGIFQIAEVLDNENPVIALDTFIHALGRFWTSERRILRRLFAMNRFDDDLGKANAERQARRRRVLQTTVELLRKKNEFCSEFSFEEVVEILQTLTGFETFDSLAGENKTPLEVVPIIQKIAHDVLKI